jgi:hypothetical protein
MQSKPIVDIFAGFLLVMVLANVTELECSTTAPNGRYMEVSENIISNRFSILEYLKALKLDDIKLVLMDSACDM